MYLVYTPLHFARINRRYGRRYEDLILHLVPGTGYILLLFTSFEKCPRLDKRCYKAVTTHARPATHGKAGATKWRRQQESVQMQEAQEEHHHQQQLLLLWYQYPLPRPPREYRQFAQPNRCRRQ